MKKQWFHALLYRRVVVIISLLLQIAFFRTSCTCSPRSCSRAGTDQFHMDRHSAAA